MWKLAQTKFVKTFYLTYGHCSRIRNNVWYGLYFIRNDNFSYTTTSLPQSTWRRVKLREWSSINNLREWRCCTLEVLQSLLIFHIHIWFIICCFFFYWLHNCSWESLVIDCRSTRSFMYAYVFSFQVDMITYNVQSHGGVCHYFLSFSYRRLPPRCFPSTSSRVIQVFYFFLA
jgi:hypothetical protein